jgi:hypothetical protein
MAPSSSLPTLLLYISFHFYRGELKGFDRELCDGDMESWDSRVQTIPVIQYFGAWLPISGSYRHRRLMRL